MEAFIEELYGPEVKQAEKAAKLDARQQDELINAVQDILRTDHGKLFLWWLLGRTHVFQSSFTGNARTFFLEGERNIGLQLYNLLLQAEPRAVQELIDYRRLREE